MAFIYDLTDTWNNAGISFNGIKINVTDTASASGSKLLNLQIGGVSKFTVGKTGAVTATGLIESTSGGFKFPDGTIQTTSGSGTVTSVSGTGTVSGLTLTGTVTSSGSLTLGGTLALTSANVTTALGFTPYNATNPAGYTTNVGTVTSVSGTGTVSGLTLTGSITTSGSLTLGGTLALTSGQVTDALGFTPYNAANPSGYITASALTPYLTSATAATTYQPLDGDLTAIAALAGTAGLVRKTAANTYSLDTAVYITGITSGDVTTALGYTPYNATNPSNYLSTVSLTSNVTGTLPIANGGTGATTAAGALTSLGAYPAANPSGYTSNVGTVTSVGLTAGTGVSVSGGPITSSGSITVTNTAPDQVVSLTAGDNVTVTGTYPNFTIAASGGGGGGSGTVTSVAASGGTTGLSFTGSPITTSGTLTLGGTLALASGGTGATTASGARTALELGTAATTDASAYATAAQGTKADTAVQTIASTDGSVMITGTTAIDLSVAVAGSTSNVLLPVRNTTGATLTKGTAVYISGATGQLSTVSKAIATSDATSAQTLGLVTANIANNSNGNVTLIGTITNIDTSAYTDGQQLYLSPTTAGTLTATKPHAPSHMVYMAVVEHAHPSQGKLFVKVQNGYEMDELHDVSAQSPANNDGLFYNTSTSLWEKKSIATALGYTPYNASNPAGYITSSALSPYLTSATAATTYQPLDGDLTAIAALAGTAGLVRKTAANTYTLDTATYLTGITSGDVTTALGYTPYNATNPAGYTTNVGTVTQVDGTGTVSGLTLTGSITTSGSLTLGGTLSLTSGNVTTALGFTPYDAANPSGYLSSVSLTTNVTGTLPIANGGTGATSLIGYVKGSGTTALTASATIPVADVTGAAPLASPTFTGTVTTETLDALGSFRSNITPVAASEVDCSLGNFFTKTASGALTWTVTNIPASRAYSFLLELTNGGTGTQTWFSGIKWPSGTAPTLTASGVDVLGFITDDGGTTWRGVQLMKDSK